MFYSGIYFILSYRFCLEYLSSDESDESDEGESKNLGSESGSAGTFGTGLGGLMHGVGLP